MAQAALQSITRRSLVRSAAAAAAVLAPAAPAAAAPHHDAELLELGRRFDEAYAEMRQLDGIHDDLCEEWGRRCPPVPEVLRIRPEDRRSIGMWRRLEGTHFEWADVHAIKRQVLNPGARLREIVAAYEGWEAERQRLAVELGITAAESAVEAAWRVAEPLANAIAAARATTPAGMAVKARAAALLYGGCDPDEHEFSAERLAWSIVRDLTAAAA